MKLDTAAANAFALRRRRHVDHEESRSGVHGTFWLVFGGCGSAVLAAAFPNVGIGLLGVSFAFGLTVLTMAYAIGHISKGLMETKADPARQPRKNRSPKAATLLFTGYPLSLPTARHLIMNT